MRKIIGTLLAFGLGYITASNDLFPYILQEVYLFNQSSISSIAY
jgi:hypothetical protein